MPNRSIIIGDVHGCFGELTSLLKELDPKGDDHVYFIGDLIDKGPDSIGVINLVADLREKCIVSLVIGNHEEKFLRYVKHKMSGSHAHEQMKNTEEFDVLLSKIDEIQLSVLNNSFYTIYLDELDLLLLHAGIPGNVNFNLKASIPYSEDAKKKFKNVGLLLMTRMLDESGSFVGLDDNSGSYFWAEKYNKKFGKVVFGHEAFIQNKAKQFPNAIGIDTGCVYGGWLTAMIIDENQNVSYISQKALAKYCEYGRK